MDKSTIKFNLWFKTFFEDISGITVTNLSEPNQHARFFVSVNLSKQIINSGLRTLTPHTFLPVLSFNPP